MPKTDSDTRRQRIEQVYRCLKQHPDGISEREIAEELGFERRTVHNYLDQLNIENRAYKDEPGPLWFADTWQETRLRPLNFEPEEAMTLYLAARLLVKQHDKRNESAENALLKLAEALTGDANVGQDIYRVAQELTQRPGHIEYSRIFRTLMQSYIYRRRVEIVYRPFQGQPFETVLSPYLLEPSAIGYATYVIGHSSVVNDLRTYKLERIESARLTRQEYTIPADFSGLEHLRGAWSIISGEKVIPVRVRFAPLVTERVRETRWHPSQEIADDPEHPGGCIWSAKIADLTDFKPWLRSWGSDAEVLEPAELREEIIREVRKMTRIYGMENEPPTPRHQLLWGKLSPDKTRAHPLVCHMLDVAEMAQTLWRDALTTGQRAHWAAALGLDEETAGRLLAFWAALHDLGKASPAFQRQWQEAETLLNANGLPFPKRFVDKFCPHGQITVAVLPDVLAAETHLPARAAKRIARAVGGHHGAWPTPAEDQAVGNDERGGDEWNTVRRELLCVLRDVLQPPSFTSWPLSNPADDNAFLTWFSGLVSVADWLGSMEEYFAYVEAPLDAAEYARRAAAQAEKALQSLRWTDWQPPTTALSFAELFSFSPSDMQKKIIDLASQLDRPALVLIEAPTGSGKTEAALYLADAWARTLQQRGLYVAMPTMATSNQMWERTGKFLRRRYPQSDLSPLLVHSQARWLEPPPEARLQDESEESTAATLSWFLPRKRSLLAPCAVGTVDQALMCVLQARHFFVRLFGLSDKTVIFDEIHAYDTYMSTLFQRLLAWLRAMSTSVVLLSATLPAQTRRELLEAYAGHSLDLPPVEYPAITWATAEDLGVVPLPRPEDRPVALGWLNRDPAAVVDTLRADLRQGGCAAVICNTIARAQEIYRALKDAHLVPDDALTLFHARYPFAWRDEIEQGVLARFGKNGARPERAIVVATQVIEQSLDLDFDVMVSDLAPVDLVVQRAGRLHRHPGRTRPGPVAAPRLYLAVDTDENGAPHFDRDIYVYTPYLLLRAYLALRGRDTLTLPADVPALIEAGYGDDPLPDIPPALVAALDAARRRMQQKEDKEEYEARKRLVGKPTFDSLLTDTFANLEEDDPDIHMAFQALTRMGSPTISLVCLHQTPDGLNTEPDGSGISIDLNHKPNAETARALARATLGVSNRAAVEHFSNQEVPAAWRTHTLLHTHRVAIFVNGMYTCNDLTLRLSRELGLEIIPTA